MELVRPVKKSYVVTFSYDEHIAYAVQHNLGNSYRGGIDYVGFHADKDGNIPIYCADKGIVNKIVYDEKGYGNCIKIKHDWGYSLYAHLKYPPTLLIGTAVDEFTILGYQGHSGNCRDAYGNNTEDASHLHFEVRNLSDVTFDPTKYIVDREKYIEEHEEHFEEEDSQNPIHVGSIVCIKDGAKSYIGQDLWVGVYGQPYKVDEIYNDRVLLDRTGICTPVNINDIYLYNNDDNKTQNSQQQNDFNQTDTYIVEAGDNLWNISQKFNTTIDNIMKLNPQITNANVIYVGQKLKIR